MKSYDSSHIKGNVGEAITATTLENLCDMKVVRNIILPRGNKYTEIDMIGINEYGVFIIENKNYNGYILGGVDTELWDIQYGDKEIYTMYNPIEQNKYHLRAFIDFLQDNGLYNIPIFNFVIFNNRVKGIYISDDEHNVVFKLSDFIKYYKTLQFNKVLDDLTIKIISSILCELSSYSEKINLVNEIVRTIKCEKIQVSYFKED